MQESDDLGKEQHMPQHEFYTLREGARILRVSERTMRHLLQLGEVHGHKLGGQWRIPHAEMARLRASREGLPPGPDPPAVNDSKDPPHVPYGEYE
jgi:excisionase family DNA binding protein